MPQVFVKIAIGDTVACNQKLVNCSWSCSGHKFLSDFKFFPLGSYDGIVGLDWLAARSPMTVDWEYHWIAFSHQGKEITLLGTAAELPELTVEEISALLQTETLPIDPEMQKVLDKFLHVFEAPTGLPPRRPYDHTIPLLPGAIPVSTRPYKMVPALKTELEKQIQEMLDIGVIRLSNSPFSSP